MSFTSEQLDDYPLCGAKKKDGSRCRMFAGAGTEHKGQGRCKWHLGNTRAHKQHAVKQQAVAFAQGNGLATPIDVTPGQAITGLLRASAGSVAFLSAMVGGLSEQQMFEEGGMGGVVPNRWIRMLNEEKDRLAKVAKAAADMGIDERRDQLSQQASEWLGDVLDATMDHMELTPKQREKIGPAIRLALADLKGEAIDVEATEPDPIAA